MLKPFSPSEFVALTSAAAWPNTAAPTITPVITGNPDADERIRRIARELGYEQRPIAGGGLVVVNNAVDNGHLQPLAAHGWRQLEAAATRQGISLAFVSGFRSLATQRSLFVAGLRGIGIRRIGRPYTSEEVAHGTADDAVRTILGGTAPPGYSKHHTGYALDLNDAAAGLPFTRFRETAGYRWLAADNFAQAKHCGFVPSYPEGAPNLGPHPEAWEFVWVGLKLLR